VNPADPAAETVPAVRGMRLLEPGRGPAETVLGTTLDLAIPRQRGSLPAPSPLSTGDRVLVDRTRRQDLRWRPGERLEQLFENRCDELRGTGQLCVDARQADAPGRALTYDQMDARANRLARHLLRRDIGPGHRVALLFDDAVDAYVAMLAVLKAGAAYVPLDTAFPADRIAYIVQDSSAVAILSLAHLRPHLQQARCPVIALDDIADRIEQESSGRVREDERGPIVDAVAYVIYTSGSTGRPKGVAVGHPSIVNFVRVAAETYGVRRDDRMYQGLTIAFDFSVEEIWVPWAVGATLVPKPKGGSLLGADLHAFLTQRRVSAMCCVPTLLATVEDDLPGLRFLLVSGEACPQDLISRWYRPGRRFLNVYGPTETTVTATWTEVHPDRPVTIGVPLPTYATVVLDPDDPGRALPHGEVGEIGIAGIGLAQGYVNRDDLTARAFVPDFLGIPGNVSRRIYRTGDLGRVTPDGEIEYLGRIDLQVKVRGYRIELTEIESVMLRFPGIAGAVVSTFEPAPGCVELVGYYSLRSDAGSLDERRFVAHLGELLPRYMVPAYLEHLAAIPMTTSDKADRKNLPPPTTRRSAAPTVEHVDPATTAERVLAGLLARTLGVERVSAGAHFFDDMGANSLLLARFAAAVRKDGRYPAPSMQQIYQNPTVAALAAALDVAGPPPSGETIAAAPEVTRTSTTRYLLCGAAQLLVYLAYTGLASTIGLAALAWVLDAPDVVGSWRRSLVVAIVAFLALSVLPVLAKWLLIGRWRAREFPVWGATYLRMWLVRTLLRTSPLNAFVGTPIHNVHLRMLGARIGAGAVILGGAPVVTDLITVGPGAIVRKNAQFTGYRAEAGRIRTGAVTIGAHAVIAEQTVLDIDTAVGDGAQLGHASSLHPGQRVPDGEIWYGSPARRGDEDHRLVESVHCGWVRRLLYSLWRLFTALVLLGPIALTVMAEVWQWAVRNGIAPAVDVAVTGGGAVAFLQVLGWSALALFGGLLTGLVFVIAVPRLLYPFLRANVIYPLYGLRYGVHRTVLRLTNLPAYTALFGDSSAIPHYLRAIGWHFGAPFVQSGSNFGVAVGHESAVLTTMGSGTMVSDGLAVMNADYSANAFRLREVRLGHRNFLGNNIAFPPGARAGENCLLATKVRIPIGGPVHRDVGLLGSPAFVIPRSVHRDGAFPELDNEEARRRLLRHKNRHNTVTVLIFLAAGLVDLYVIAFLSVLSLETFARVGLWVAPAVTVAGLLFGISFHVLLERAITGFRPLRPMFCSVLDPRFWEHERFWKMTLGAALGLFNGTPMKSLMWRALGVRIGRRVFDDGCGMPEKTLVTIGDDVTLNAGTTIQAHSLEDGAFKSDHITIGAGSTLAPYAFVHYGVNIGPESLVDTDAFLMKGTETAPRSRWSGNPATEQREAPGPCRR
jgi:non-ribosomal peptide synthetase-like protein